MDRDRRSIVGAISAVIGITVLMIAAAIFVPFRVNQTARIVSASGAAERIIPGRPAKPLDMSQNDENTIKAGQGVRVLPDGMITLSFDLFKGRAVLRGPAAITLVEAYRRATLPGHALDNSGLKREYVLTLEQTGGLVRYDFAHSTPPFDEISLTIQLPDGSYTPTAPCWLIEISAEGVSNAQVEGC